MHYCEAVDLNDAGDQSDGVKYMSYFLGEQPKQISLVFQIIKKNLSVVKIRLILISSYYR